MNKHKAKVLGEFILLSNFLKDVAFSHKLPQNNFVLEFHLNKSLDGAKYQFAASNPTSSYGQPTLRSDKYLIK